MMNEYCIHIECAGTLGLHIMMVTEYCTEYTYQHALHHINRCINTKLLANSANCHPPILDLGH